MISFTFNINVVKQAELLAFDDFIIYVRNFNNKEIFQYFFSPVSVNLVKMTITP